MIKRLFLSILAGTFTLCLSQNRSPVPVTRGGPNQFTPQGIAADAAGNAYVALPAISAIRKIAPDGAITTVVSGTAEGAAQPIRPTALTVDPAGNLYFVDAGSVAIRKASPSGKIETLAGNGTAGSEGDGGPATAASFRMPQGLAADSAGNIYVADTGNNRIRKISKDGIITTVAGSGVQGFSGDGGPATSAQLVSPLAIAVDAAGAVYFTSVGSFRVRKVSPNGVISTVVGTGAAGFSGDNGPATAAQIGNGVGLAVDKAGNLYIADGTAPRIRKVTTDGVIHTIAGDGTSGASGDGGPATSAQLRAPTRLAVSPSGDLYISDTQSPNGIRKVTSAGVISTVAFNLNTTPSRGAATPTVSSARRIPLFAPQAAYPNAALQKGAAGVVLMNVTVNSAGVVMGATVVRSVSCEIDEAAVQTVRTWRFEPLPAVGPAAVTTTPVSMTFAVRPSGPIPRGSEPLSKLKNPTGIAVGTNGNVYISDTGNARILRVINESIFPLAGTGKAGLWGDGAMAAQAQIKNPSGIIVDASGDVYFADAGNSEIRRITANGVIGPIAGRGSAGFSWDTGRAVCAEMKNPTGLAMDAQGNIFIADSANERIRKVTLDGNIDSIAGNGTAGFGGDGGPAIEAKLNNPVRVAVDNAGNVYIADSRNGRIRKISADGKISTIMDQLKYPASVYVDGVGNLFVVDSLGAQIKKMTTAGQITTVAGTGVAGFSGDGGPATGAQLKEPNDIAVDAVGNIYIVDTGNNRIRKITPDGVIRTILGGS